MDEFGKVAVGEIQRQYLVELKDKIKHKYNQFRNENEKQAEVSWRIKLDFKYGYWEFKFSGANNASYLTHE